MAGTYYTPGVYVEEISSFPASVSPQPTSVPAFVGYTEKVPAKDPNKIGSLVEFEALYGGPDIRIKAAMTGTAASGIDNAEFRQHIMWYALVGYFANGGGPCYIASAGVYPAAGADQITWEALVAALEKVALLDEPTLLVAPEAFYLDFSDLKTVVEKMLGQAGKLKDRFAILDAKPDKDDPNDSDFGFDTYRWNSGTEDQSYGAAYFPEMETLLEYKYLGEDGSAYDQTQIIVGLAGGDKTLAAAITAGDLTPGVSGQAEAVETYLKANMTTTNVILPPSALIAGAYCSVDRSRGVWKAPANISLNFVKKPKWKMSASQLKEMNIPVDGSGKAINAIRTFTGRGTLVWGARTLDGNSNEWRYIPVRRLYNMVEESVKKATEFSVFEPNDANTWTRIRAMIENFLTSLWRDGALAGAKPEEAFFVNTGLGSTMTPQDVLEGRLIIEIGMAAVRPAEFIILKFSHKLADS